MGEILIATSGYSYADWVGPVYPPGMDKRDLRHEEDPGRERQ